ncbi:hypothetical protein [Streptomyces lavendulae]|uniref:hypothetical protein n=1 Tax=Streptomyces lavendulae TaxID=1914 RepID=UPI0032DB4065
MRLKDPHSTVSTAVNTVAVAALVLLAGAGGVTPAGATSRAAAPAARFVPGPCPATPEAVAALDGAKCGFLEVPENRSRPSGRAIRLAVAVIPAASPKPVAHELADGQQQGVGEVGGYPPAFEHGADAAPDQRNARRGGRGDRVDERPDGRGAGGCGEHGALPEELRDGAVRRSGDSCNRSDGRTGGGLVAMGNASLQS